MIQWQLKLFKDLSPEELYSIMRLRQEVFIVEQNCPYLDADGKDFLNRICKGAERMGQLIDDMSKLSRLNREEMILTNVNLSTIADEVFKELQQTEPERTVQIIIQPERTELRQVH